jgi:hypothetical protein
VNVLFLTQNRTLDVFDGVRKLWVKDGLNPRASFYVADGRYYLEYLERHPQFERESASVLKEWELASAAKKKRVDDRYLEARRNLYGAAELQKALGADRRLILGPFSTLVEDRRRRYSDSELQAILEVNLRALEDLFDREKPDLVVSFICVTLGEYLASVIARARGIRFVNLRPSRIRNYFFCGEDVHEPSAELSKNFASFLGGNAPIDEEARRVAQEVLDAARKSQVYYEGVIPAQEQPKDASLSKSVRAPGASLAVKLRRMLAHLREPLRSDPHFIGFAYPLLHARFFKRRRMRQAREWIQNHALPVAELKGIRYAFYPLHKEPEVTLLVYGRGFTDQLEAIRRIAAALPQGMRLVVKEHPACVGYRSSAFYRELLSIPNVSLVRTETPSRDLVEGCALVTVIGGSVGLEAVLSGKPVVTLGHTPFEILPRHLLRRADSYADLPLVISQLLADYRADDHAVKGYLASVIQMSTPLDFYSKLLGRENVVQFEKGEGNARDEHLRRLARFLQEKAQ